MQGPSVTVYFNLTASTSEVHRLFSIFPLT